MNLSSLTPKQLRQSGIKTSVCHWRYLKGDSFLYPRQYLMVEKATRDIDPRGGETLVIVTAKDGKTYAGKAICSKEDNFCYRRGVNIALGRLNEVEKIN
jgi:hypothetical protein